MDAKGFYGNFFDTLGDYYPSWYKNYLKKNYIIRNKLTDLKNALHPVEEQIFRKKRETIIKDTLNAKKSNKRKSNRYVRGMEMSSLGFHGDTFNSGFGDFVTMKRSLQSSLHTTNPLDKYKKFLQKRNVLTDELNHNVNRLYDYNDIDTTNKRQKEGRYFGNFEIMKKRRPEMDSMGFHGDTFGGHFGDFETMKKRRPEMDSMGFHGDTFGGHFGAFETMKKRRPEMDSFGFHGDTFGGHFGDFETMKKRKPLINSFNEFLDNFGILNERRPEMDSMGFHGDTFGGQFGDFETKSRRTNKCDCNLYIKNINNKSNAINDKICLQECNIENKYFK